MYQNEMADSELFIPIRNISCCYSIHKSREIKSHWIKYMVIKLLQVCFSQGFPDLQDAHGSMQPNQLKYCDHVHVCSQINTQGTCLFCICVSICCFDPYLTEV